MMDTGIPTNVVVLEVDKSVCIWQLTVEVFIKT